jgi:hypothetical protein
MPDYALRANPAYTLWPGVRVSAGVYAGAFMRFLAQPLREIIGMLYL